MIKNQGGAPVDSNTPQLIKLRTGLGHAGYVWEDKLRLKWYCVITQAHFPPLWLRLCFEVAALYSTLCLALINLKLGEPRPKTGALLPFLSPIPTGMSNSSALPSYVLALLPLALKEQSVITAERYISGECLFTLLSRFLKYFRSCGIYDSHI